MPLNQSQKTVILIAAIVILLMGIFPPLIYTFKIDGKYGEKPAGYAFVLMTPPPEGRGITVSVKLNISRLLIQWLVVAAAGAGIAFLIKGRARP